MSAGFKYDLVPPVEQEERYDVQTGIRRRGPFKLDTQNLVVGSFLPGFTPICADLKNTTITNAGENGSIIWQEVRTYCPTVQD